VRATSLAVGPYSWQKPLVTLSGAETGALASEDYAGNIGNQILQRFTCTLDYERRVLYLEPGVRYAEPDEFPRSGLQLARYGDQVLAFAVLTDSPAARAGLREQDELVAIDGKPAREWTPDTVAETIDRGRPGSRHTFEVERGGKRLRFTLVLRDLL
jgi:predicted metalloprotease with PDZ domain